MRAEHLRHETAIVMMGGLYYAAAACLLVAAVATGVLRASGEGLRVASFFGMLAAGSGAAAFLMRRLDARARFSATLMGGLGFFAMPVGTVLSGYVLYLVHSAKGRRVLSPEYRAVVAKTPEFKCRVTDAALALGLALVLVAVYQLFRFVLGVRI